MIQDETLANEGWVREVPADRLFWLAVAYEAMRRVQLCANDLDTATSLDQNREWTNYSTWAFMLGEIVDLLAISQGQSIAIVGPFRSLPAK